MPIETYMQGKVALVTGAASGIGEAIALEFAHQAAKVVVADLDEALGRDTVSRIQVGGGDAQFVRADVSNEADVEALVQQTIETYGGLHYAVNNAGISGATAPIADYPTEDWHRVISINLTGVWLCMKHELRHMAASGGGVIVNMASILGQVGFATSSAYVAAKHGVIGLTQTAALEYATQGIRVNAVCPGFIDTPLLRRAGAQMREQIASWHPLGRLGTAEEVARLAVFLCSEAASFITGEAVLVDGGYVAR